jgi:uncharacterized protein (TIGR03067 family)
MNPRVPLTLALLLLVPAVTWGQDGDELDRDRKLIQGTWAVVAYDQDGKELPAEIIKKMSVRIQADTLTIRPRVVAQRTPILKDGRRQTEVKFTAEEGQADEAPYRLGTSKKRKGIELTLGRGGQARKVMGAYELAEDNLTICLPLPDGKLPKQIPAAPKAGVVRLVLKRAPAGK